MVRSAGNDEEYFDTLYKYWGRWGYYSGLLSTLFLLVAAVCAYFIIMSQMLYPIILALIKWIFSKELTMISEHPTLDSFS
jgi:hypothetical protein